MIIYRFRQDGIFDAAIEWDSDVIPRFHTFQKPPSKKGHYAVMSSNGWTLISGEPPFASVPIDAAATKSRKIELLSDSDWTQLPDCNLTDECKIEFAVWRQQLRDMDNFNPNWPDRPIEVKKTTQPAE